MGKAILLSLFFFIMHDRYRGLAAGIITQSIKDFYTDKVEDVLTFFASPWAARLVSGLGDDFDPDLFWKNLRCGLIQQSLDVRQVTKITRNEELTHYDEETDI